MGKWLLRAGLVVVLLAGVYAALPWYSARQLIEAAHQEDTATLERYVDFPRLRMNIRERLKVELQQSMGADVPPELGGLFTVGADILLGPLVDRLISPQGVSDLIQGRKNWQEFERDLERVFDSGKRTPPPRKADAPPQAAGNDIEADEHDHRWQLRRWYFSGLDTVVVICGSKSGASRVRLLLQREGFRWKLVDMHLINSENGDK